MTTAAEAVRDIDRVLRPLSGLSLYRKNAFRITGLPTDATARQIRRARKESTNAYYVPPAPPHDVPLPPSQDPDELQAAFDVLQDPVARLVHEMFWVAPGSTGRPEQLNQAVRLHCSLVVASDALDGPLDADEVAEWHRALSAWASHGDHPETRRWLARRIEALDDPRLTTGTARAVRSRLHGHLAGVNAQLAARAVTEGDLDLAPQLIEIARDHLDTDAVVQATRTAAAPFIDRIKEACSAAEAADLATQGIASAHDLLRRTSGQLNAISILLGEEDAIVRGCSDDIALAANNGAVGEINSSPSRAGAAVPVLRKAAELATAVDTRALVRDNLGYAALVAEQPAPARAARGPRSLVEAFMGSVAGFIVLILLIAPVLAFGLGFAPAAAAGVSAAITVVVFGVYHYRKI